MLLLHDQRMDDNVVRAFLFDCYDLYVKVSTPPTATALHCTPRSADRRAQNRSQLRRMCALSVQLLLNPFYDKSSVITSRAFDDRVRAIGDKYLNR